MHPSTNAGTIKRTLAELAGDTVLLFVRSAVENGDHYIRTLVGGSLSYYTVDLAWGWVAVLYLLLFGEKEPEYLTYREQQLLVLEGVDRNQYDPERFSVDSQGWLQYQSGGRRGVQGIDVSF